LAIASGVVAYTGTYTVDDSTKTIHANIETSSFTNLVGAPNQRRVVTSITDDELKFTNPHTPAGITLELVFKRAKQACHAPARGEGLPWPLVAGDGLEG
jgi:hypothetical protein